MLYYIHNQSRPDGGTAKEDADPEPAERQARETNPTKAEKPKRDGSRMWRRKPHMRTGSKKRKQRNRNAETETGNRNKETETQKRKRKKLRRKYRSQKHG